MQGPEGPNVDRASRMREAQKTEPPALATPRVLPDPKGHFGCPTRGSLLPLRPRAKLATNRRR